MFNLDKDWILNNTNNGVITSRMVSEQGIHRSVLQKMVESEELVRCSRGIYILSNELEDEYYLLQQKYGRGIYSHATALYLHGYSERVPISFHMTFPIGYNCSSLKKENIIVNRVIDENFKLGLVSIATPYGNQVNVYDVERCLCDILKAKGDDIQIVQYAMKKYASSKNRDINKLMKYAKKLHVETKARKYMEVLM